MNKSNFIKLFIVISASVLAAESALMLLLFIFPSFSRLEAGAITAAFLLVFLWPAIHILLRKPSRDALPQKDLESELVRMNAACEKQLADEIEQLKALLAQNRMLIETSTDAIISVDEAGEITEWNSAAFRLFGYSREESIGQGVDRMVPEKSRERHAEGFRRYLDKGEVKVMGGTGEFEALRKDGTTVWIELSLSVQGGASSQIITAIIREITQRKKAEFKMRGDADVTKKILSIVESTAKTVDIEGLLTRVVGSVEIAMDCDYTLSYLWDKEANLFRPAESSGLSREMIHFFKTASLSGDIPAVKEAINSRSFVQEVWAGGNEDKGSKEACKFYGWIDDLHSVVLIPLVGMRAYLGMLVCIYRSSNEKAESGLTARDREIVNGITRHVSVVLEDARLYKDSISKAMELSHNIETIQVMQEIDRSILSALESEDILETAAGMISRIIQCDRATVALADRDRQVFTYAAGYGLKSLSKGSLIGFEDTIATEALNSGASQYLANLKEEVGLLSFEKKLMEEGFVSHIRTPIMVKGEGQGFLCIGSKRPAAFTPKDLSTLETLASQIGVALENARLVKDIEELFMSTIRTLSEAIDAKSSWTRGHSERMTKLAMEIGTKMGLPKDELKKLELAGLLHDLGKIGTYETILNKPDKLSDGEVTMIRSHPLASARILAPIKQLRDIIPSIKAHHEFYNGAGYPDGLKGKDIPPLARILGVADAIDAMGADRPYRKGLPMDEIITEIRRCAGTQLDPEVVEAFLSLQKERENL